MFSPILAVMLIGQVLAQEIVDSVFSPEETILEFCRGAKCNKYYQVHHGDPFSRDVAADSCNVANSGAKLASIAKSGDALIKKLQANVLQNIPAKMLDGTYTVWALEKTNKPAGAKLAFSDMSGTGQNCVKVQLEASSPNNYKMYSANCEEEHFAFCKSASSVL